MTKDIIIRLEGWVLTFLGDNGRSYEPGSVIATLSNEDVHQGNDAVISLSKAKFQNRDAINVFDKYTFICQDDNRVSLVLNGSADTRKPQSSGVFELSQLYRYLLVNRQSFPGTNQERQVLIEAVEKIHKMEREHSTNFLKVCGNENIIVTAVYQQYHDNLQQQAKDVKR